MNSVSLLTRFLQLSEGTMTVQGQPVSKSANGDWCRPNDGYGPSAHNAADINLNEYEVIAIVDDLPANNEQWPKGAAFRDTYKVGNKIAHKKTA
jgi:hypothetical protein